LSLVEACGEAPAAPPPGYTYAECPPLATDEDRRALIGRNVLTAHASTDACGWFVGTVKRSGDIKSFWKVPGATHLINYSRKQTGNALHGTAACVLSSANYGPGEWWLLLEPIEMSTFALEASASPSSPASASAEPDSDVLVLDTPFSSALA